MKELIRRLYLLYLMPEEVLKGQITMRNVLSRLESDGSLQKIVETLNVWFKNRASIDAELVTECIYLFAPRLTIPEMLTDVGSAYVGAIKDAAEMIRKSVCADCKKYDHGCPNCHLIEWCNQRRKRKLS